MGDTRFFQLAQYSFRGFLQQYFFPLYGIRVQRRDSSVELRKVVQQQDPVRRRELFIDEIVNIDRGDVPAHEILPALSAQEIGKWRLIAVPVGPFFRPEWINRGEIHDGSKQNQDETCVRESCPELPGRRIVSQDAERCQHGQERGQREQVAYLLKRERPEIKVCSGQRQGETDLRRFSSDESQNNSRKKQNSEVAAKWTGMKSDGPGKLNQRLPGAAHTFVVVHRKSRFLHRGREVWAAEEGICYGKHRISSVVPRADQPGKENSCGNHRVTQGQPGELPRGVRAPTQTAPAQDQENGNQPERRMILAAQRQPQGYCREPEIRRLLAARPLEKRKHRDGRVQGTWEVDEGRRS